jgi:hypothetical protein
MIDVTIPGPVPSAANLREYWAARHRRTAAQREAVLWMLKPHGKPPGDDSELVVTFTRYGRMLDGDNLQGALKAHRDGVADWLGRNDADPRIEWRYRQMSARPAAARLRIEIEAAQ